MVLWGGATLVAASEPVCPVVSRPRPRGEQDGVPKATGAAGRARDPESGEKSEAQLFCFFVLSYGGRR